MVTNLFAETIQIQGRLQLRFTFLGFQEEPSQVGFESGGVTTKNVYFRIMHSLDFSLHFLNQQHPLFFFLLEKQKYIKYVFPLHIMQKLCLKSQTTSLYQHLFKTAHSWTIFFIRNSLVTFIFWTIHLLLVVCRLEYIWVICYLCLYKNSLNVFQSLLYFRQGFLCVVFVLLPWLFLCITPRLDL